MPSIRFTVPGQPVAKQRHRGVALQRCKRCGKKTARRMCPCGSSEFEFLTMLEHTPRETEMYENRVAMFAQQAREEGMQASGPVHLTVDFFFAIPESRVCKKHPRQVRLDYVEGTLPPLYICSGCGIKVGFMREAEHSCPPCKRLHEGDPHTQRPDLDNCIKSIKDGCNKILWLDDCIVSEVKAAKFWGNPRAEVAIEW